jgi:hypothetical protein
MGQPAYIAATCCGFINIVVTIAVAIAPDISPPELRLIMRHDESLFLTAQLFIC